MLVNNTEVNNVKVGCSSGFIDSAGIIIRYTGAEAGFVGVERECME